MTTDFGLGILPSDVRQARLLLAGMRVADPYWRALLVATYLKADATNRAKLERGFPGLAEAVVDADGGMGGRR